MKKTKLTALFITGVLFCGCNNTTEDNAQAQTTDSVNVAATEEPNPFQTTEEATTDGQAPVQQNTAPDAGANPYADLKGINPAHGEPGHRCDIDVGAPLNSPSNKNAAAPTINQSAPSGNTNIQGIPPTQDINFNAQPNVQPATTAPGMNPPHGQPGHDCAVAVGAPLPK
ncbi:MAG: hypothetical protein JJE25_01130 [Bacteroidia bacterium]|nr:hypothetical protein [Bacteroidia bacterium]